ncbi:unnamed protein product [Victoria cruziana]
MDVCGLDSGGREFQNAREMWTEEIGEDDPTKKRDWYRKGVSYWEGIEASVDGVLGGYGHVNQSDVKGSESLLGEILLNRLPGKRRLVALDCGSGIGRVTRNLLLRYFNEVDLVEPVSHFLETARQSLAVEKELDSGLHRAVNFFCVSLQDFTPEVGRYDVIWVQWCISQLADDDFVSFFRRAKAGLKPGGFFVVKENVARSGFVLDKEDKSITRSDSYFKQLFKQADLYLYKTKEQKGFPEELFPVRMYALTAEEPRGRHRKKHANSPAIVS